MAEKKQAQSRFPFTKTAITELPPPSSGRVYHYDSKLAGLAVCVTKPGTKTFYVYRRVHGRPVRYRLGQFPTMTVEQARKRAAAVLADIANNEDPQAARQAARAELTVGQMFDHWLEYAKQHKKTWKEDQRLYANFVQSWKSRRLSSIRKKHVQELHTKIGHENGHTAANRVLSLLRAAFNKAGDDLEWIGTNPAARIKRFAENERDRFLQPDELPRFFESLNQEPDETVRDFFLIALLTGARKSNVLEMRWDQVSMDGTWRIPDTKSGKPVYVPLVPEALRILQERRARHPSSEWVFPGPGRTGHLIEVRKAWVRICKRAELPNLRIHDLRRTLGSWQAATGASLPMIGKTLGHGEGSKATAIYARLNLDPVREAANKAATAMLAAANGKGAGHDDS
jgi:integrase